MLDINEADNSQVLDYGIELIECFFSIRLMFAHEWKMYCWKDLNQNFRPPDT